MSPIHDDDFNLKPLRQSARDVRESLDNLGNEIARQELATMDRRAGRAVRPLLIGAGLAFAAFVAVLVFAS